MSKLLQKLTGLIGRAATPVLAKVALALVGLILALFVALMFQTWRIGNLHEKIGELKASARECENANAAAVDVIERMREAIKENAAQRAKELQRQRQAAERIQALELEVANREKIEIRTIERLVDNCADTPVPDSVRLLFNDR